MPEMTVRSSTRGLPGLPRGRCGLSAFQASSDSQNKIFAMTIASCDSNQEQIYNQNQLTVWVLNLTPIPKSRLNQRERRDGGGVGAQDARSEAEAQHARLPQDRGPLAFVESALRANQQPDALGRRRGSQRLERIRLRRLLVAEDERALGGPARERRVKRLRRRDLGKPDHAALLGGLARIGGEAREIEA